MVTEFRLFVEKKDSTGKWKVLKGKNPQSKANLSFLQFTDIGFSRLIESLMEDEYALSNGKLLEAEMELLEEKFPKYMRERDSAIQMQYQSEIYNHLDSFSPMRYSNWIYSGINYFLFQMLGRNKDDNENPSYIQPIKPSRGLPSDVSDYIKEAAFYAHHYPVTNEFKGIYGQSYLSLRELLSYSWDKVHRKTLLLEEDQYAEMVGLNPRRAYGPIPKGIEKETEVLKKDPMEKIIIKNRPKEDSVRYLVEYTEEHTYKELVKEFYTKAIPILEELSDGDAENIRMVYWFNERKYL